MSELQRIESDLARAKQRVLEMENGQRGVSTLDPKNGESMEQVQARRPHAGLAFENQLLAQRMTVQRLEGEYVFAMIAEGKWQCADLITRMSQPR